jgi:hypothetical protein
MSIVFLILIILINSNTYRTSSRLEFANLITTQSMDGSFALPTSDWRAIVGHAHLGIESIGDLMQMLPSESVIIEGEVQIMRATFCTIKPRIDSMYIIAVLYTPDDISIEKCRVIKIYAFRNSAPFPLSN